MLAIHAPKVVIFEAFSFYPPQRGKTVSQPAERLSQTAMNSGGSHDSEHAALLAAVAKGDERAFLALYDRFSGPIYSLLLRMLHHAEDAEEVLQAAFLQVWKKAATYDPQRCAPFTWLVLIARSKAIDRLRQKRRQTRLIDEVTKESQETAEEFSSEDSTVWQKENAAAVKAALEKIPAEQRQAIELAFFEGLSQSEIAETLAEPLGTIKARIRRGMLRLRDYLVRSL